MCYIILIVYKMWEPRRLTTLWAPSTCYRDSFKLCVPSCVGYVEEVVQHKDLVDSTVWFPLLPSLCHMGIKERG
jgi:hypothetical protein